MITGGAGFIGSAVVRLAVTRGHHVLNVDKLTYAGSTSNVAMVADVPSYEFVQADIADEKRMRELFEAFRPDAVLNLAAETHVDRSIDGPDAFVRTNLVGTYALLHAGLAYWRSLPPAAAAAFRFLHISTDEVYGTLTAEGVFTEDSPLRPNSPYAASKAGSDLLVRSWHQTYGFPCLTTNCSNNYGPYQYPEKLLPVTILSAWHQCSIPVYGEGRNVRDWLFVEDHAEALLTVLATAEPGSVYNIGWGSEVPNIEIVRTVCAILDELRPAPAAYASLIRFVEDRPGHDFRYAVDDTKIRHELGWTPRTSLEEGLQRTVCWYLENESWWRPLIGERYEGKRLGLRAPAAG